MSRLLRRSRRIVGAAMRRIVPPAPRPAQLEMVWPEGCEAPEPPVLPAGFTLRTFREGDEPAYFELLKRAAMGRCPLEYWLQHLVPGGFFVIDAPDRRTLAATCLASHHPAPRHPFAGNLGWLATDPSFAGQGLGRAATAAVVRRLTSGGYRRIYLTTDDARLPAIKIYLRMGWVPLLFEPGMAERWRRITEQLSLPFSPAGWPTV